MYVKADVRYECSTPVRRRQALEPAKRADGHATRPVGPRPRTGLRPAPEAPAQAAIRRACQDLVADMFATRGEANDAAHVEQLREFTKHSLRQGLSIDAVHRVIQEATDRAFEATVGGSAPGDPRHLLGHTRRLLQIHGMVTSIMASTLVEPAHPDTEWPGAHTDSLATALAEGRSAALPGDFGIASSYAVLAVAIQRHRDEEPGSPNAALVAQRKLGRIRLALDERTGSSAVATLGVRGGTVLLPALSAADGRLDQLVADLARAAQVPITAIVLDGSRDRMRDAADLAHDLLDVAVRLRYPGGLYRFADLALEYQLTRPGPTRDRLETLLDPLGDHPGLLHTLLLYIHTDLGRQRTARILRLHRNTIDYRLHRIRELTGYDPAEQPGLWYLQSALVVRAYCRNRPMS